MILHSYSPKQVLDAMAFQKAEYCLCVAAAGTPPAQGNDIVLACYPSDWVDEPDPMAFSLNEIQSEIIADKKTQRWLKFQQLVKQWKDERGSRSSITQAATLQPYQKIIGMGDDAVPLIISQLRSEGEKPDQWFWALKAITLHDPVKPEDRGNFRKMAQAWILWYENNGW